MFYISLLNDLNDFISMYPDIVYHLSFHSKVSDVKTGRVLVPLHYEKQARGGKQSVIP